MPKSFSCVLGRIHSGLKRPIPCFAILNTLTKDLKALHTGEMSQFLFSFGKEQDLTGTYTVLLIDQTRSPAGIGFGRLFSESVRKVEFELTAFPTSTS